jgi:hypothetical protein
MSTRSQLGPDGWNAIRSPAGEEFNHPVAVRVNCGGEITEVTKGGTHVYSGQPSSHGVRIEIDFHAEWGMHWTLALMFAKGETYAGVLRRRGEADVWPETVGG